MDKDLPDLKKHDSVKKSAKELANDMMGRKKKADKLYVEEAKAQDDNSMVQMTEKKMKELGVYLGDHVIIRGNKRKECPAVCVAGDKDLRDEQIRMNKCLRKNLRVHLSDMVKVIPKPELPNLVKIQVLPFKDSIEGLDGDFIEGWLKPYFENAYRPVQTGNYFIVRNNFVPIEFKIVMTEPNEAGIVAPNTILFTEGEPVDREDEEALDGVGYDDVGGCRQCLAQIREMIELPLRHPVIYNHLGVKPPRGVLLYGPPGCGKTLIARAVANETGAFFFLINGPEIMSKMAGEAESNLRKAFEKAEEESPAIIFIDEIDSIAPKRDKTGGEVEKRVVAQLLTLMDGIKSRKNVVVLAATNRPNVIDTALRRVGRFDREINIGVPDEIGRMEILKIHTKNMKVAEDVDLENVAKNTQGFVGSDIKGLCQEAAMQLVRENMDVIDLEEDSIPVEVLEQMVITQAHFKIAIGKQDPSALRDVQVQVPDVTWDDIGGLLETKKLLQQMIMTPMEHPELYEKFNLKASRGVLFYGPPGTGKTMMAKAVANECSSNFISVKGPELLTMWVGESESNVRDIFDKARQAAPCVLFFDELDSIAKKRGSGGDSGVGDRVINQILCEMDGVGAKKDIFFVGATNRPWLLDTALLRNGRLDSLIYIPLPDREARKAIFKACSRKKPVAKNVDFDFLAQEKFTAGFSGSDCAAIVSMASANAVQDCIEKIASYNATKELNPDAEDLEDFDPVPEICRKHFEKAMLNVRCSVGKDDMSMFEQFKRKYDPAFKEDGLVEVNKQQKFDWGDGGNDNNMDEEDNSDDDDDIY